MFYKCAWKVLLSHCLSYYIQCPTGKQIMLKPDGHGYLYAWQMATHSANKNLKKAGGLAFPQYGRCVNIAIVMTQGGQTTTQIIFFIKISKKAWHRQF